MRKEEDKRRTEEFVVDVYMKYRSKLLRIAQKYVDTEEACEDVFHDAIICIINKADFLRGLPDPKLEAYLCLLMRGISIDRYRKEQKQYQMDMSDELINICFKSKNSAQGSSVEKINKVELDMMLSGLSEEDKMLLIGKYYLGLDVKELIEIFGGTSSSIRTKLCRIRKKVFNEWRSSELRMEDFL